MACQILLDFSPRTTSLALSDTSGPGAPLGRTQTGTIRQRRWHPRSKYGCITCRHRHLRCDEEKPVCRRCISSRIICRGYDNPTSEKGKPQKSAVKTTTAATTTAITTGGHRALQTPPDTPPAPPPPVGSETSALEPFGSVHSHSINVEVEPPDWDLQEGIRYYAQVVLPGRNVEVRSGGGPDFHAKTFRFPRFISQVIGDQISRASKARGTLLAPGQYPAFTGVWARYSQLLSSSIRVVNEHILDEDPNASWRVLVGIDQLLVLDLYVERSLWQAHLRAFFEYIQQKGGIAAVLNQPEPPFYCLNHVLTIAINVNTTSPAKQQIHGFDDCTDDQLISVLESAYSMSMQCPTELYVVMVYISRLRAALARAGSKPNRRSTEEKVRHIFDSIDRFNADDWAAKPEFRDKVNVVATLGRIFAVAVRLYGIMTLPPSAVVAWMMAVESEPAPAMSLAMNDAVAMCNTLRIWQREELLALARQSWGLLRHTTSLCWPLVVAGVAFADGAAEDQDFIEMSLLSIWKLPNTSLLFLLKFSLAALNRDAAPNQRNLPTAPPSLACLAGVPSGRASPLAASLISRQARESFVRINASPIVSAWDGLIAKNMVLKFVIEDPLATGYDRSSSSPEAPLGRTETGEVRQRRWAPRARTGCLTCRARRIKCDETRPVCRRCTVSRITCRGYTQPSPTTGDGSGRRDVDAQKKKAWLRPRGVSPEIEPMDWEFQETVRYFFEVVEPSLSPEARRLKPSDLKDPNFPRHMLYANVVSDQLERASKARGRALRPGEDPAFEASWAGYHRSVLDNISAVNRLLREDAQHAHDGAPATLAILQLLISDLKVALALWAAHLRGFLAYVAHRGGATRIMALPKPEKSRLSPILAFTMQINTHCPADQQIKGSDDFTDDEIRTLIGFDPSKVEPCPVEFHLARVRITRLRVALARGRMSPDDAGLALQVCEIFDTLWRFDLEAWAGEKFADQSEEVQEKARGIAPIYAVAIRLYGILTLPAQAVGSWAESADVWRSYLADASDDDLYKILRRRHGDELLRMLREGWVTVREKRKPWLAWPLTVVGVAVADGKLEADRVFVYSCLMSIWRMPDVSNSSITALEKLRVFWGSGRTGWEECFDEPIPSAV